MTLLAKIPNLPDPTAADGMDEDDAQLVRTWGEKPKFDFEPRDSTELGSPRGWIDMARGARLSGSRFAYRIGDVAMTEMALYRFVIDKLTARGFLLVLPPVLANEGSHVRDRVPADRGIESLPPGARRPVPDRHLRGRAGRDSLPSERLDEEDLPARYTAFTTNFRREAGAAGKDTKGMFRVHQFDKVEMFVYCCPEESRQMHDCCCPTRKRSCRNSACRTG